MAGEGRCAHWRRATFHIRKTRLQPSGLIPRMPESVSIKHRLKGLTLKNRFNSAADATLEAGWGHYISGRTHEGQGTTPMKATSRNTGLA